MRAAATARATAPAASDGGLDALLAEIRACRVCMATAVPLPHEPRPIFQISSTARVAICSQAPGNRAHIAGLPFKDPSGVRLRAWMGLGEATFYDASRIAIIPMGFCFPGYDRNGGDLPPRRECRATWHDRLFEALPQLDLLLSIGKYSQDYHLPDRPSSLTETVRDWRSILSRTANRPVLAMPHPSWRNNAWLRKNPWFEAELLPVLRARIAECLDHPPR